MLSFFQISIYLSIWACAARRAQRGARVYKLSASEHLPPGEISSEDGRRVHEYVLLAWFSHALAYAGDIATMLAD